MHDFETLNAKTTKSIKRNTKRKSNSAQDLLMLEFLKFLSSKMHQTCICSNFSTFSSLFRNVSPSHQSSPKKWRNLRNSRFAGLVCFLHHVMYFLCVYVMLGVFLHQEHVLHICSFGACQCCMFRWKVGHEKAMVPSQGFGCMKGKLLYIKDVDSCE